MSNGDFGGGFLADFNGGFIIDFSRRYLPIISGGFPAIRNSKKQFKKIIYIGNYFIVEPM